MRSITPIGNPEYGTVEVQHGNQITLTDRSDKSARLTSRSLNTSSTKEESEPLPTECPFSDFGCNLKLPLDEIKKHIKDGSATHLLQMCEAVSRMANNSGVLTSAYVDATRKTDDAVQRMQHVETLFSSQYTWRLTNYSSAYANARRGQPAVVYSPAFFSHRNGYKLALALAPYGDADAIGESNSIFITILRGEHDAILPWPFICPVTFTMLNQKNGEDVSQTLTPRVSDANMAFIGRPYAERNPAFGLKSFVELRTMEERDVFVRNNACFIRVHIDLSPIGRYI
ncbi:unnamed protein product [Toxocara canis]|uniref:MATH domain-containing protein n=1 Tax=Toxocara canis TaxID=6265 RepID=A0A183VAJ9_TOXCA|nr:unnamed protein product [Toxocara canis]